jgi:hypothetical protein
MDVDDEENLFGDAPMAMRVCPKCVRGDMIYGLLIDPPPEEVKVLQSWCSKVFCKVCRFEWYVCRVCPNIRERLDTQRKLSSHSYKYHRECHPVTRSAKCAPGTMDPRKKRKKKEPNIQSNFDTTTTLGFKIARQPIAKNNSPSFNTRAAVVVNPLLSTPQLPNPVNDETPSRMYGGVPTAVLNCNFGRIESRDYYGNNYHDKNGLLYIISEAFYAGQKTAEDISTDNLEMFTSLSLLVKNLSTDNCDVLGNFIDLLFHRIAAMETCSKNIGNSWRQFLNSAETVIVLVVKLPVDQISLCHYPRWTQLFYLHFHAILWRYVPKFEMAVGLSSTFYRIH